ncbi:MAG: hypothetical protein S0880_32895 [Actinomycetota bacterium]|nr:hypothetical protein [Actinomycetota bacterium]
MATTRTSPLRARAAEGALDGHPLDTVAADAEPAATSRPVSPPGVGTAAAPLRGSLHSLDWRQAVGGALVVLGMLAIVIAWFGVSGTLDPGEQMPYISSGGFGGSALTAVGVTLLVSFEHSRDRDALAQVLEELDELRRRLDAGTAQGNGQDAARSRT